MTPVRPRGIRQRRVRSGRKAVLLLLGCLLAPLLLGAAPGRVAPAITAAPLGTYAGTLSFDVMSMTPEVVTAQDAGTLTITGSITNTGDLPVSGLDYRFQRGAVLPDSASLEQEIADPSQPLLVVTRTDPLTVGQDALGPGESTDFTAEVALTGDGADALGIDTPGVFPLMLNVNGYLDDGDSRLAARVGELHVLITVLSLPAGTRTPEAGQAPAPTLHPVPTSVIWSLVDRPHLGINGIFLDDDLVSAISTGGRLDTILEALEAQRGSAAGDPATLVVDPALLDELDRMSAGYRVTADRNSPQPALTPVPGTTPVTSTTTTPPTTPTTGASAPGSSGSAPPTATSYSGGVPSGASAGPNGVTGSATSPAATGPDPSTGAGAPATTESPSTPGTGTGAPTTGTPTTGIPTTTTSTSSTAAPVPEIPGTVAGTGQAEATAFLGRLREVTEGMPVIVLPYGDPDLGSMIDAGLTGQLGVLVGRGGEVARRVLGGDVRTTTAYPEDGLATPGTLSVLRTLGYSSAVLDASGLRSDDDVGTVASVAAGGGRTLRTTVTGTAGSSLAAGLVNGTAIAPVELNTDLARLVQTSFAGNGDQLVVALPRRGTAPSSASLLSVLVEAGVLGAAALPGDADPIGTAPPAATADGAPEQLPADYMATAVDVLTGIDDARTVLTPVGGVGAADPEDVFGPLESAMGTVFSTAARTDPTAGTKVLRTASQTLTDLQAGVKLNVLGEYTLASNTSPLIVTVRNDLPYNAMVQLQVGDATRYGLTVKVPAAQRLLAGRNQQVRIETEVTRSGSFSIELGLATPAGKAWGQAQEVKVSSSAYGLVTILIIVIAGAVLLVMVVFRIAQRVRAARAPAGGAADGDDAPEDTAGTGAAGIATHSADPDGEPMVQSMEPEPGGSPATAEPATDEPGTGGDRR
ncbi:hypothetical protein GIS00_15260 [Nakamurella sp. YIM 132087]|uniref:Uncharacterized protein n=1 Tax=Nakamurella alba TaxID=2665158 RepID=A0A7K1FMJ6_9ACTN|nr:DUF6049 family protein [Nakamurella alba]MTD15300.1 hypothetical protein [Nakamurella alba]